RWRGRARVVAILAPSKRYEFYLDDPGVTARDELKRKDWEVTQAAREAIRAARKANDANTAQKMEEAQQAEKRAKLDKEVRVSRLSVAEEITRLAAGYPPAILVGTHPEHDGILPTPLGKELRNSEA